MHSFDHPTPIIFWVKSHRSNQILNDNGFICDGKNNVNGSLLILVAPHTTSVKIGVNQWLETLGNEQSARHLPRMLTDLHGLNQTANCSLIVAAIK